MTLAATLHPWMGGWIVVRSNPYAAASGARRNFRNQGLAGRQRIEEFQFWREMVVNLKEIKGNGMLADGKGAAKIMIKPGDNDLGDIKVPVELLLK